MEASRSPGPGIADPLTDAFPGAVADITADDFTADVFTADVFTGPTDVPAPSVLLVGDLARPTRLTVANLRAWPQHPLRVTFGCSSHGPQRHSYTGALLHDVAASALPGSVPALRKDRARYLLCVTGADGHQAVLSWAEIDPEFARFPVLLATRADGASLDALGPQLVVPHDRCGVRYISTVTRIWIGSHHDEF